MRVGSAHVDHHGLEVGRPQRRHRRLRPARPRGPPRPHLAIAPRLLVDPLQGVVPVLGLGQEKVYIPLGLERPPAVLIDGHVPTLGEKPAVATVALHVAFVVRRAVKDCGELAGHRLPIAGGEVQVGRQPHAVAHLHHYIAFYYYYIVKAVGHSVVPCFTLGIPAAKDRPAPL